MCEMRSVFRAEEERDSVLDRGEAALASLREVSDPSRECRRSAINDQECPIWVMLFKLISYLV